jgi:hypothetical protein
MSCAATPCRACLACLAGLFRSIRQLIQHKIAVTGTSRSLAADLIRGGSALFRHRA